MTPYASVVVPTHDRASTLAAAIASVQRQSVPDIEIIIAGDGVTPDVRAVAQGLASSDPRVRFMDAPKARGWGGRNRDHAVRSAAAERIFYTDDDDLWLPSHVATLGPVLDDADVADTLMASIGVSGRLHLLLVDNSDVRRRQQFAGGTGKTVFDTHVAHRKSAYLGLGTSWADGNVGHLFGAFARSRRVRWKSRGVVTALSLHGGARAGMSPGERRAEVDRWAAQLELLARQGVLRMASPAWWTFRTVKAFGGVPPIRAGFVDLSEEQSLANACSLALARGEPCRGEVERLLPFLLDRVLKGPSYEDLAGGLVSALGAERAGQTVRQLGQAEAAFRDRARLLEAHILALSGRTTDADGLLTEGSPDDRDLNARRLQLRAQLRLPGDPVAAAALAVSAARLTPHDRNAWRVAFGVAVRAGETQSAQDSLQRFAALISTDDRLEPEKRASWLAKREKMEYRLIKLRSKSRNAKGGPEGPP